MSAAGKAVWALPALTGKKAALFIRIPRFPGSSTVREIWVRNGHQSGLYYQYARPEKMAVTLYYGSVGVKNIRHTLAAAITADVTAILLSAVLVRVFFG